MGICDARRETCERDRRCVRCPAWERLRSSEAVAPCVVRFAAWGYWPRYRELARGKTKRSPHNVIEWPTSSDYMLPPVPRRALRSI